MRVCSFVTGASPELKEYVADVLVLGGGPAGAWAALAARMAGAEVILADKGYFGTSGATAPSNTETWCVPPGRGRAAAIERHIKKTGGLCDAGHADQVLDGAWQGLQALVAWRHPFAVDDNGQPYLGNLRGPDYMRFLRRRVIISGTRVLDHHPALELLGGPNGVAGAAGVDRQLGAPWQVRCGAVVLATGGCAFGERMLGATGLTGDGYLMAVEAGAGLSGMELSAQYAVTPAGSSLNKGMPFRWASFYDRDGRSLGETGEDRQEFVAAALSRGRVFACFDKADGQVQAWLRQGQPNCFLPYDRRGVDPFKDRFEVTLRCEGTVRGVGGVRLADATCATDVPGLFAAGDVASREALTGASSGGGGPNSSWAIASGRWAGSAAARSALADRRARDRRSVERLGRAGLGQTSPEATSAILSTVSARMLPLAINFHRRADTLAQSRRLLDDLWSTVSQQGKRAIFSTDSVRRREAASMLATARWSIASAQARAETRGMHRRADFPTLDPLAPRRLHVKGIDEIVVGGEALA